MVAGEAAPPGSSGGWLRNRGKKTQGNVGEKTSQIHVYSVRMIQYICRLRELIPEPSTKAQKSVEIRFYLLSRRFTRGVSAILQKSTPLQIQTFFSYCATCASACDNLLSRNARHTSLTPKYTQPMLRLNEFYRFICALLNSCTTYSTTGYITAHSLKRGLSLRIPSVIEEFCV